MLEDCLVGLGEGNVWCDQFFFRMCAASNNITCIVLYRIWDWWEGDEMFTS